jgi:beta-lactamase regulating signal transducer with metallopeptidase domain
MSRPMLVLSVALAAYAVLSTIGSIAVAAAWRVADLRGLPAHVRARKIVLLRVFPSAAAALVTLGLVVPAFVAFEPARAVEAVGPVLLTLAGAGALLLFAAVALAIRTALVTIKLERAWLRSATAFDFDPPAGIPAYAIDSPAPIVALVGVFSPKLLAARAVIDACSQQELANIVAHEHGHFRSMDNFKRWLMTCAPDALRWSPMHREMTAAWGDAAEDAADDAATAGEALARVDLAALLLKVARLAQGSTWSTVAVSPFVDADGLDRRVRRLLEHEPPQPSPRWMNVLPLAATGLAAAVLAGLNSPATLKRVHEVVELVVTFAR